MFFYFKSKVWEMIPDSQSYAHHSSPVSPCIRQYYDSLKWTEWKYLERKGRGMTQPCKKPSVAGGSMLFWLNKKFEGERERSVEKICSLVKNLQC